MRSFTACVVCVLLIHLWYYTNSSLSEFGGKVLKQKNVSIELLRIVSMVMIVYHHFYTHSQFEGLIPFSKKAIILQDFGNFGKIGVLLFGLITGYFLIDQTFKLNRIVRLSNLVRFYTLISFFSWLVIDNPTELIKENLLYALFPIIFERYWFVTAYAIVLLFQPMIKHYLVGETRANQLKYFVIIIFSFSIVEWIGVIFNTREYFEPSEILSFIIIVLGGHLIRLYQDEIHEKWFAITVGICLLTFSLILLKPVFVHYFSDVFAFPSYFLTGLGSPNAILFSMSFFSIVTKINLNRNQSSWIMKISPLTFDVYLLHDNKFFRPLIWTVIFKNETYITSSWFPLIVFFEPLIVFSVALLIGKVRLLIFQSTNRMIKGFKKNTI